MKVLYTRPALADIEGLGRYIEARSPQGALRVRRRIKALIERLADQPFLGKQTVEQSIRRLTAIPYPYLIFYEATDAVIIIHAIRHGSRNPTSMPGQSQPP